MWRLEVVLVWRFQREQHWVCFEGHRVRICVNTCMREI